MNNIRTEGNGWWWLRTLIRKAGLRESGKHFVQPSSAVSLLRGWSDGHDLCSANSIMILSEPTSLDYAYLNAVTLPRLISEPSLLLGEHTPHHADNFWLIYIYRRSKEGFKNNQDATTLWIRTRIDSRYSNGFSCLNVPVGFRRADFSRHQQPAYTMTNELCWGEGTTINCDDLTCPCHEYGERHRRSLSHSARGFQCCRE